MTTIARFIVNGPDYFAALLSNGSVRVGLRDYSSIDLPPAHDMHAAAMALKTEGDAEAFIDAQVTLGNIPLF